MIVLVKKRGEKKKEECAFLFYLTVFMSSFSHRKNFKYLNRIANFLAATSISDLYHFTRGKANKLSKEPSLSKDYF